jgi:hypothetical protein
MIPAHVRIFLCTQPIDFRRGFDGLALAVIRRVKIPPQSSSKIPPSP